MIESEARRSHKCSGCNWWFAPVDWVWRLGSPDCSGPKNNGGRIPRGIKNRSSARFDHGSRYDNRRRGYRRRCGGQRSIFWQFHHNGVRKKRRGKDPITGKQFSAGVQHDRLELVRFFGNGLRKDLATVFRNQDIVLDADTDSAIDIWRLLRLGAEIEPGLDG